MKFLVLGLDSDLED